MLQSCSIRSTLPDLSRATKLQSLLLFSCEVGGLDEATGLGQGEFQDPTTEALQSAGRNVYQQSGINAFASVSNRSFANTALSFAGNMQARLSLLLLPLALMLWFVQLLRKSAYIPLTPPSRLLQKDVAPRDALLNAN